MENSKICSGFRVNSQRVQNNFKMMRLENQLSQENENYKNEECNLSANIVQKLSLPINRKFEQRRNSLLVIGSASSQSN